MPKVECPIHAAAARTPNAVALVSKDTTFTYAAFDEQIARCADGLRAIGVRPGSRVVILEDISIDNVALLPALWRLEAVACPFNARLSSGDLIARAHEIRATHVVAAAPLDMALPTFTSASLRSSAGAFPETTVETDSLATLIWTSGSMGHPKAAIHHLSQHWANAHASNANLPLGPGDRWLLSLPTHHVSGLAILFRCWLAGASVAFAERETPLADTVPSLDVTHVSLVPTQLRRTLATTEGRQALGRLKAILLGGGPLPASHLEEAEVSSLPVYATYGMTEMCSQIATTPGERPLAPLRTPARALIPGTVRVAIDGEIQVCGETLFAGYLRENAIDLPLTRDGWFATGDMGTLDGQGALRVTGRKDNMFVCGGENVHPEAIERALSSLADVDNAVVVPIADDEYGHRPVAFVRMRDDAPIDAARLVNDLRQILPRYAIPRTVLPWPADTPEGMKPNRALFAQLASDTLGCNHRT